MQHTFFCIFQGQSEVNETGMQSLWWVWFIGISVTFSSEGLSSHSAKIYTLEFSPLIIIRYTKPYKELIMTNCMIHVETL